jgi:hypothetical protein
MRRTNIYLDEDRLRTLKHLAAEEGRSVADIVRGAIDSYLAERVLDDETWRRRMEALVERVQGRIPPHIPPDEIDADITAAREEVRRGHRAAHRR